VAGAALRQEKLAICASVGILPTGASVTRSNWCIGGAGAAASFVFVDF
jgi:hypothetical protein